MNAGAIGGVRGYPSPMTLPRRRLWFAIRIAAAVGVAALAIAMLSSWALAILVGSVTILAVVVDGLLLARTSSDQIAIGANPTPLETISVDLRRRR